MLAALAGVSGANVCSSITVRPLVKLLAIFKPKLEI